MHLIYSHLILHVGMTIGYYKIVFAWIGGLVPALSDEFGWEEYYQMKIK